MKTRDGFRLGLMLHVKYVGKTTRLVRSVIKALSVATCIVLLLRSPPPLTQSVNTLTEFRLIDKAKKVRPTVVVVIPLSFVLIVCF